MVMTMILISKNIENAIKQPPMKITTWNNYTSIIVVTATHILAMPIVAVVDTQRSLVLILVLSVKQIDTNMLYPYGLLPHVNNNSHEQDVQVVAHHIEKGD